MNTKFKEFVLGIREYQNCIINCKKCSEKEQLEHIKGFEKPRGFLGKSHIKAVVVGHSPYVRTYQKAEYVLKMDKPKQGLYKYITGKILNPLDIDIDNVCFTNLFKCLSNRLVQQPGWLFLKSCNFSPYGCEIAVF
jgi:hypothetical protein